MKKIEIAAYGAPEVNARCVEAPDLGAPGPGEVTFDVLAFPINPADLSFCRDITAAADPAGDARARNASAASPPSAPASRG